jgi:tRNA modification GTPase
MSDVATYVACLTPAGSAAIGTVGLAGPNAWNLVEPRFRGRGGFKPVLGEPSRYWLGRLGEDVTDDVVLTVDASNDRQRVEIHCHGGNAVVRWMLDLFRNRGAVEIGWEEWLQRTLPSQWQAEAAIALAHAPTLRTAGILLDQFHGALEREMAAIHSAIATGDFANAKAKLETLISRVPLGRHLTQPWRVVVAGAPNAGKSTLINALLGYQRAITSPIPGTTRDVVTALTAFDAWPVELVDTAGLRDDAAGLEALGIERANEALANANLCLWVVDRTQEPPVLAPESLDCPMMVVCNKSDLADRWRPWSYYGVTMSVSALTGQGVGELAAVIGQRLVPEAPPAGAAVPFTEGMCREIELACKGITNDGLQTPFGQDTMTVEEGIKPRLFEKGTDHER